MSDQTIIDEAVELHGMGEPIDSLQARVIANAWHGGQWSALYSFTSTGAIREDLEFEIESEIRTSSQGCAASELGALLTYVRTHGEREPEPGWSSLHW